jgi:hypothetical protein
MNIPIYYTECGKLTSFLYEYTHILYRVRQSNFLFHMAFHIQKRKLAYRTLHVYYCYVIGVGGAALERNLVRH